MKIGIITYHCSYNYGAQLQAYALCKFLRNQGYDAEIIDCNTIGKGAIFSWSFVSLRSAIGSLRNNILSLVSERKRHRLFDEFAQQMIKHSESCYSKAELNEVCKKYDYIITGSDQVWHPMICEGNTIFFLDLPIDNSRKIAYAPSFGVSDYTSIEVAKYMPLIAQIGHLSVREEAGKKMIRKYIGRDVPVVLDPTLLLDRRDWDIIAKPSKYTKYLLYFSILDEPIGTDQMVRDIAYAKGLRIVRIGTVRDITKHSFINARANGPQQFLGLIREADFIVTTSFHGCVFSILYRKQFLCVLNDNDRNSRMETLLGNLGLEERIVRNVNAWKSKSIPHINYDVVTPILGEQINKSIQFLKESITK